MYEVQVRFVQRATHILQLSGSQYATLKVRVYMYVDKKGFFSNAFHLRDKLIITRRHSPWENTEDSNVKIKCEIHKSVYLYIENCTC